MADNRAILAGGLRGAILHLPVRGQMMNQRNVIPVIDLFAGPGGLGEGFTLSLNGQRRFSICLSIEKEAFAHRTLTLRAFFRQFPTGRAPAA